ncbi:hypothetical protein [Kribbella shirazensis]|uniref:Uncharacterized protein n=1 Tax=Kribbella shirazensis TaxID=1105143 RepID=A0A7X6A020_9ACTN|nr:hypothetical protein [Kribbella shirazensis]NIK55714.1 hypothetical protein [Kribbella shirazensis]
MLPADVQFEYRVRGKGWGEGRLQVGPTSVELTASYLDDALGDLVRGALALARGAAEVRFAWAEEPGEFRWILTRLGESLSVRVLWFDDGPWSSQADEHGSQLLAASCDPMTFCMAVADGARAVRDDMGTEEYKRRWAAHDFPNEHLDELLALKPRVN